MIITKFVDVKIVRTNHNHYKNLGYDAKYKSVITIPIEHLTLGSHVEIEVKCDYCGLIIKKMYRQIIKERKDSVIKKDCCKNCANKKRTESNLLLYYVENTFQRDDIKQKIKTILIERYGYDSISKTEENKKKISEIWKNKPKKEKDLIVCKMMETQIKRYGMWYTKTEDYKEKKRKTCIEKYGTDDFSRSVIVRDKYKNTIKERYDNVDNYFATKQFKSYIKQYWMLLYGVDHYSKTDNFHKKICSYWDNVTEDILKYKNEKTSKTVKERYGVDYVFQLESVRESIKNTSRNGSKPQYKLYSILKEIFPEYMISYNFIDAPYTLDILLFFENIKIDIEYDCSYWHTPELDKKRDNILIERGYKILRIKSGRNIPEHEDLKSSINILLKTEEKYLELFLIDWNETIYKKKRGK